MSRELNPGRVLVVDDDQSIRQLVCTIARRQGVEAECVADGAEAIEKLSENEYSLILLDLMMPRVDGFGVIEFLRDHPPSTKPIVLVVTAYADQRFKQVDPDIVAGVVRKPFEVADLGNLIRLCIDTADEQAHRDLLRANDRMIRDLAIRKWQSSDN